MIAEIPSTVCALSTPRGQGGIAIVRMSGPDAIEYLECVFEPSTKREKFPPNVMMHGHILNHHDEILDEVLAVIFPAPHSYTREDVAEIHCHGGEICAKRIIQMLLSVGCEPAAPGEFTKRAYLNGRIDLARAEAVMQLISANSEAAARASVRQLEGGVSTFVTDISNRIVSLLALISACDDFPEEIDEEATIASVRQDIVEIRREINRRIDPEGARILREGASIVLAGRPNVGKSSVMNALLNQDRAIVTAVPGTTRDVLTEKISLGGVTAELTDTAGQHDSDDPIEQIGVSRAKNAMNNADVILIVLDAAEPLQDEDIDILSKCDERAIILLNKIDRKTVLKPDDFPDREVIKISAKENTNICSLLRALEGRITAAYDEDDLTVERHIECAKRASEALRDAVRTLDAGYPLDVISIDLDRAMESLAKITNIDPNTVLIEEIFSKFCVGK